MFRNGWIIILALQELLVSVFLHGLNDSIASVMIPFLKIYLFYEYECSTCMYAYMLEEGLRSHYS